MIVNNEVVVHLPAQGRMVANVSLVVQVEDASESDVPAVVMARLTLDLPLLDLSNPVSLRFEIPCPESVPNLSVSGALMQQGSPTPRPGDLITARHVTLTRGGPNHLRLVPYLPN